jgi:apolipoprotein N-acyltransferase
MGTHLSAYSQSSNSWLIQYLDITGMWGLSCWLLYMNVIGYQLYRAWSTGVLNRAGILRWGLALAGMLLLPLGYAAYAAQAWATTPNAKQISISLLPTQFSAQELLYRQDRRFVVERTLLRNDELAFAQVQYNQHPDLYLWPETGLAYDMGTGNLAELLREAVTDWDAGLLTGGTSIPAEGSPEDRRTFISGILISPDRPEPQYHHKTVLTPLQETLPYHRWLARIPGFSVPINDPAYRRRGTESQPLPLLTRRGETFALGVSLCFEQWYPQHWARLARNGAELYCHLAAEGWYGEIGFQVFMANVSRMRAIENRRAVARCSNVGISGFYDRFGNRAPDRRMGQNSLTAALPATQKISFYSRFPNWFPLGSLLAFVLFASLLTKRYYV